MNYQVTIVANGSAAIQDNLGLDAYAPDVNFLSQGTSFGKTARFTVTGSTLGRLRSYLVELSQRRVPALDAAGAPLGTGKTMPLLTYDIEPVPGDRPCIDQVEGSPLSVGTPLAVTLRGTNLLAGLAASLTVTKFSPQTLNVYPGTASFPDPVDVLRLTDRFKGPIGNRRSLVINPEGAASVVVAFTTEGDVLITVTPAVGASTSTAIAAQLAANTVAAFFVTATALVASAPMGPTGVGAYGLGPSAYAATPRSVPLTGGDGGGQAVLYLPGLGGAGLGVVTAVKGGNQGNLITLTLNVGQGGNTVVVSGTNITVNRTEAAPTIANVVGALTGNASAAALVSAQTVAAGTLAGFTKSWLYGGSGETPVVKIGGAPATITAHSDTAMALAVLAADLTAASAAAGETAMIQVAMNYGKISAPILLAA